MVLRMMLLSKLIDLEVGVISADVGPIPRIGTTPLRSLSPILHLPRDNRIHALRTRTQHSMHLIGNIATYSNVFMWQKVIGILHGREQVGSSWKLCCPRHAGPDTGQAA